MYHKDSLNNEWVWVDAPKEKTSVIEIVVGSIAMGLLLILMPFLMAVLQ